jgi:dimethylhistidine N-methyltransferase
LPACADFTGDFEFPQPARSPRRHVVYFPGSTIGNFERPSAVALLSNIAIQCGTAGGLLLGFDLQKDPATIEAAYNDTAGITAQFNQNILVRMNNELGANFEIDQFEHLAFYDPLNHRVDLRLISRCAQTVRLGAQTINFSAGEPIHTEYSHKYTVDGFCRMASEAGLTLKQYWTDRRQFFAVAYFECDSRCLNRGWPR